VKALENEQNGESINNLDDMEMETVVDIFEDVHGILMHWSPEKIRYYYELMRQKSSKQETIDDENVLVEKRVEMD